MNDDDLPEITDEMLAELRPGKDLHLGPASVKSFSNRSWAELYGPQPPGTGIRTLDTIIAILSITTIYLIVKVWIWLFTTSVTL